MFKRILISIDVEEPEYVNQILSIGAQIARDYKADLHVITVVPDYGMSVVGGYFKPDHEKHLLHNAGKKLSEHISKIIDNEEIFVRPHVAHGKIYDEVISASKKLNCDLIVIGAHQPALRDYLLGPNAARVVRHAGCSVFVVRE